MFSNYMSAIAPIIAILNSVIAVGVSQFKPEDNRIKIGLLVASIVLGCLAASATIYGQGLVLEKQEKDAANRAEIRAKLGSFIVKADEFLATLADPNAPMPEVEVNAWANAVEAFLQPSFGPGYVERFRSGAGLSHGIPDGMVAGERLSYWNGVYERSTRLQEFSREIPR
jgi:hypothetical protein